MSKRILFFLCLLCSSIAQSLIARGDLLRELDQFIEEARGSSQVPGVAVSIVKGDQLLFAKGYGHRQCHSDERVDENTIFQIASLSKPFLAAAFAIEADRKIIGWDGCVGQHLAHFSLMEPYANRWANVRDLLAHRLGLGDHKGDLLMLLGYDDREIMARIGLIAFETSFRNRALYSNLGYFIAGQLLQEVTGKPFQTAMSTLLFDPLQLSRTGFSSNLNGSNVSSGHVRQGDRIETIPLNCAPSFTAPGGMTSTAGDLATFMQLLLNGGCYRGQSLIQPSTVNEMFRPIIAAPITFSDAPPIDENSSFCFTLGWDSYQYQERRIIEKGGGMDGIRVIMTLIPELKMGIAVLTNLNLTYLPEKIRAKFLELFVAKSPRDIQAEIAEKEGKLAALLEPPSLSQPKLALTHPLDQFVGIFRNDLYGSVEIVQQKGQLALIAGPAHLPATLDHWSNDTFLLRWQTANSPYEKMTFIFGPNGQAIGFQTETLGNFRRESL